MTMKQVVYIDVIDKMYCRNQRPKQQELFDMFPWLPRNTIVSIFSQDYQRQMRRCHGQFLHQSQMHDLYQRYLSLVKEGIEGAIIKLADQIGLAPTLLARIILEKYLLESAHEEPGAAKSMLTQLLNDSSAIDDPVLAIEIEKCCLDDEVYGPTVDCFRRCIGLEYEKLLENKLKERNLSYLGEDQLRKKGYDKTPDFILDVPIGVDGKVVSWVESKASFGDIESHTGYLKDQLWSYWNRFGPGLVIYWFGFIDELDSNRDKGIIVMDHFPEKITAMNPGLLASSATVSSSIQLL